MNVASTFSFSYSTYTWERVGGLLVFLPGLALVDFIVAI